MEDGEFQIGPSSKEELKADLKDMVIQLWWVWLPLVVIVIVILWKLGAYFLSK